MPRQDGTGPQGMGPGTGRGMGTCGAGNSKGMGMGFGRGRGRGLRCRYANNQNYSQIDDKKMLEEDAKYLKTELKAIEDRLNELK